MNLAKVMEFKYWMLMIQDTNTLAARASILKAYLVKAIAIVLGNKQPYLLICGKKKTTICFLTIARNLLLLCRCSSLMEVVLSRSPSTDFKIK